jgi:ADP-ribosylglycohydrolase
MDFGSKVCGAVYGGAIGDAMGAPVEGWTPQRISARFGGHDLATFLPPTHGGDGATGKGDGRITDDTLMIEAFLRAYAQRGDHMDAYGYADLILPQLEDATNWIPERQRAMPLIERLWWPEKYPFIRLRTANVDPRSAGVGNCVNCGVAMWIMPAGAVNAGDPAAAYQEAAAVGCAHNESFAVEAAAVLAAAFAAAFGEGATMDGALAAALGLARDATEDAIAAVLDATDPADSMEDWIANVRGAFEPFDQRTRHVPDDKPLAMTGVSDIGHPSRLHTIEEAPVAFAALKYGGGDWNKTLRAGVFYGRDCDSIAGMACGLHGALHGASGVPECLRRAVDAANRREFGKMAEEFVAAVRKIHEKDKARFAQRARALGV